jgi:putative DNA modification/repair radical SAM protein
MTTLEKLEILSDAAKYDVSCSTSGTERGGSGGLGNAIASGICHSWSADGRCISLLKILLTNYCIYDCSYCVNRKSNDTERVAFSVDELVDLTINFYRRNYIEGLFLSSGILKDEDTTQGMLLNIAKKLRLEKGYNGYIHMKAIPGASRELIRQTGKYVDRMSLNIELPSENSLKFLAPEKSRESILKPMKYIGQEYEYVMEEKKQNKKVENFLPAGQTTQMIVGASPDSDKHILKLTENLYDKMALKRVYYSAYVPVNKDNKLPSLITAPPLLREHRLYQADWLLRFYGFKADEILTDINPFLDEKFDPKINWALNNLDLFPVEITTASKEMLLRVPGIGPTSVYKILKYRNNSILDFASLKKMGIVLKRAKFFITIKHKYLSSFFLDKDFLSKNLAEKKSTQLKLY